MIRNSVKTMRKSERLTQAGLAAAVGVCPSYIAKLENKHSQPSLEVAFCFAEHFKCKIEDVFRHLPDGANQGSIMPKSLPDSRIYSIHTCSGHAGVQQTGHSARTSSGNGAAKDRSLVGPTAKVVASPVALASQRKIT